MKGASASAKFDRWMWWPTACTVAMELLFLSLVELPGLLGIRLFLLAIVACPTLALLLVGMTCVLAWHRQPRRAASTLAAVVAPVLLLGPTRLMALYVHLGLTLAFGIGYLSPNSLEGQNLAIYDWTTGYAGGPNTFLIHDVTDAIALPLTKVVPPAWRDYDLFAECAGKVQPLIGHYYVCFY
jgi:hypothetical protein